MFQAVAKFQNDYKIYVSHKGIMEQRTMAAIDAAYRLKLSLNSIGQVISSKSMQRAVMEIIKGTPSGNTYEIVNRGKLKQGNIYQVFDPQGYEKNLTYSVLEVASYIPAVEYAAAAGKIFADNYFGNDATASTMELLNNATIDIAIVVVTGTVGKAVKIVKNVKKVDKAADVAKQVKKTEAAARTKGGSFKYNLQFFASSKGASKANIISKIKENPGLVKAAEEMGKNERIQQEANHLIQQLISGNTNPGKGSKNLFKDINYLRGDNGARVFYRLTKDGIQILGKSSKANEQKVINILKKLYN